jgi:hypothetical protein
MDTKIVQGYHGYDAFASSCGTWCRRACVRSTNGTKQEYKGTKRTQNQHARQPRKARVDGGRPAAKQKHTPRGLGRTQNRTAPTESVSFKKTEANDNKQNLKKQQWRAGEERRRTKRKGTNIEFGDRAVFPTPQTRSSLELGPDRYRFADNMYTLVCLLVLLQGARRCLWLF